MGFPGRAVLQGIFLRTTDARGFSGRAGLLGARALYFLSLNFILSGFTLHGPQAGHLVNPVLLKQIEMSLL